MLVQDGVVRRSTSRKPGAFQVSNAETMLGQA
jgi:peroxiredoxin